MYFWAPVQKARYYLNHKFLSTANHVRRDRTPHVLPDLPRDASEESMFEKVYLELILIARKYHILHHIVL